MSNIDDEALDFGYLTPPLSPSKTVSTEGWLSPRTPVSPRKTQSCIFVRNTDAELSLGSSPDSSTRSKQLRQSVVFPVLDVACVTSSEDDSLQKKRRNSQDGISPHPHAPFPNTYIHSPLDTDFLIPDFSPQSPPCSLDNKCDIGCESLEQSEVDLIKNPSSPTRLFRIPLRHASSPLRPSQWIARGGSLTAPRHRIQTPDRFIPSRRPPHIARESFEMNKPAERLAAEERLTRSSTSTIDPFGGRLHRSYRLNEELRSLRATHAVLTGRTGVNRHTANPNLRRSSFSQGSRHISAGAVWHVGGSSAANDTVAAVPNGSGGMLGSGTNAPLYTSVFLSRPDPDVELEVYERRLALALDVDQTDRILQHTAPTGNPSRSLKGLSAPEHCPKHFWRDSTWSKDDMALLLDAPQLRDDYYCSLLAYSHTAKCLAVGLGNFVHLWSEKNGVDTPESLNSLSTSNPGDPQHVTSLSFSSVKGGQAILAVGRADGRIALWSPFDFEPRFDATQPKAISCLAFRPSTVNRPSLRDGAMTVPTEELLVGDEAGQIYFYSIEWPSETNCALFGWNGAMTLLARLTVHSQQICGLSWTMDGGLFASGGNDNACYLFETKKVLQLSNNSAEPSYSVDGGRGPGGESIYTVAPGRGAVLQVPVTQAKHKWELNAAVKAIAFCPWQRGLLAIGGGSNDRCIHFYHTMSGACLATIDCAAQVTSLIWSQTRREIAATFGFAQPEHPYRIAVFAWPSCEQVVSVPWFDENRALFAIAYPGGPESASSADTETDTRRAENEGCIVVAASDAAIRFHEIWMGGKQGVGCRAGLLGGSDILESLHGIEREGDATIR